VRRLIALVVLLLGVPAAAMAAPIPSQLPAGVEPVSYELSITPDAGKLAFTGHVAITVEVNRSTPAITLNALDLTLGKAAIDGQAAAITADPKAQTATFAAGRTLAPGRHVLDIDYSARINDSAVALFRVDYAGGRMLATQFEPADARRFLPCFDEPAKKATFMLEAVVPKDQTAVSNMPAAASDDLGDGRKRVRFAATPKMSTYLLFFGLGDLVRVSREVEGTLVSVVIRRGDEAKAQFALDAASELLPYYNSYFGRKYPLPKLDLVAAPGDVSGSMENWGAILFSQTNVVVDPKISSPGDKRLVYGVVAHEMAHLWSGDLVTMAWWDDLWLNEGVASWMARKATDHFHPEWGEGLLAVADKDEAMLLDARPSTHPIVRRIQTVSQAEQAFDAITYKKGEAVIRMLEAYAGETAWRDGVRAYIARHAYGAATSDDLWREIDKAAGKPVSAVARDFTLQPGVPLIHVAASGLGEVLTERHLANNAQLPAITIASSRSDIEHRDAEIMSWRATFSVLPPKGRASDRMVTRTTPQSAEAGAVVNAGQTAYVRVAYEPAAFAAVAERLPGLAPIDQIGLLKDALALGMTGETPLTNYLRLSANLPADAHPLVWYEQSRTLAGIDGYYAAGPARADYRAWAWRLLAPQVARVGYDARPGDTAPEALLRETLLLALGQIGDPAVRAEARRRFEAARNDLSQLAPGERRWVLVGAARSADAKVFAELRALAKNARDPLVRNELYAYLATVEDEALAQQVLALAITDEAPTNLAPALVREVAVEHPELAWRFTLASLPAISRNLDALTRSTFVPRIASASHDMKLAAELEAYAAKNIPPDAQGEEKTALAQIRNNADIQTRRLPQIGAWIAAHPVSQRGAR
jgi:aminopeptidase N